MFTYARVYTIATRASRQHIPQDNSPWCVFHCALEYRTRSPVSLTEVAHLLTLRPILASHVHVSGTPQDLDRLIEGAPSSAVILNEAWERGDALPLSQVLTTLLRGPTRSFTALVGYFGYRVDETAIERYGSVTDPSGFGQVDGEDLAGLIVREAVEENLREGQSFDQTAFRLLAGAISPTAQGASRAWYWLCRSRHEASDGKKRIDSSTAHPYSP